jgi:hypothetical protein
MLDVLASITNLATGNITGTFVNNGTTTRFRVRIPADRRKIAIRKALSARARAGGSGILTLRYAGNARVRRDELRLRAATRKALLRRTVSTIDSAGNLVVRGTISRRARGVVVVRLDYVDAQGVHMLDYRAPIAGGAWSIKEKLPQAARTAGGQLTIQFTGYGRLEIRGEQLTKALGPG